MKSNRPSQLKRALKFLLYAVLAANFLFLVYNLVFYYLRHSDEVPLSVMQQFAELEELNSKVKEYRIPNIVHFVFGMRSDFGGKPFSFTNYLSIKSAHQILNPEKIIFHYFYEPGLDNKWYQELKKQNWVTEFRKWDEQKFNQLVLDVVGKEVPLVAHKADILRVIILKEIGGIYMDTDVFVTKSFDSLRKVSDAVMGMEAEDGYVGLANAIILSKPNGEFINMFWEEAKNLDPKIYNYYGVQVPKKLSQKLKGKQEALTVLNHRAFFWPLWYYVERKKLFEEDSFDFRWNFAVHLWESKALWYLQNLTPEALKQPKTAFERLAKWIWEYQSGDPLPPPPA